MQLKNPQVAKPTPSWRMLAVAGICLVAVTVILVWPERADSTTWLLKAVSFAVAVTVLGVYWYVRYGRLSSLSQPHTSIIHLQDEQAYSLQRSVGRARPVTLAQAKAFTFAVLFPAELRQRVVEEYEPSQRALKQTVYIDVSFRSLSGWNAKHDGGSGESG